MSQYDIQSVHCPHCDAVNDLSENITNMFDGDSSGLYCVECEQEFEYTLHIEVTATVKVPVEVDCLNWDLIHGSVVALWFKEGLWTPLVEPLSFSESNSGCGVSSSMLWRVRSLAELSKDRNLLGQPSHETLHFAKNLEDAQDWVTNNIHVRPL